MPANVNCGIEREGLGPVENVEVRRLGRTARSTLVSYRP